MEIWGLVFYTKFLGFSPSLSSANYKATGEHSANKDLAWIFKKSKLLGDRLSAM